MKASYGNAVKYLIKYFLYKIGLRPSYMEPSYKNVVNDLIKYITCRNSDSIASCFSNNAISKVGMEQFDEMLSKLYEYCEFDHIVSIDKRPGSMGEGSVRGPKRSWAERESYDIETDDDIYRLCVKYVDIDQFDENNEGIWSLSLLKCEGGTNLERAYWGDGSFAPGIWLDKQSARD